MNMNIYVPGPTWAAIMGDPDAELSDYRDFRYFGSKFPAADIDALRLDVEEIAGNVWADALAAHGLTLSRTARRTSYPRSTPHTLPIGDSIAMAAFVSSVNYIIDDKIDMMLSERYPERTADAEHVPTTQEIRDAYISWSGGRTADAAEFDRWLDGMLAVAWERCARASVSAAYNATLNVEDAQGALAAVRGELVAMENPYL